MQPKISDYESKNPKFMQNNVTLILHTKKNGVKLFIFYFHVMAVEFAG